jgi:hypothetical protein
VPRSPSRDLSDRFIGSRRYFRHLTPIEKWKFGLSRAALVVLAGWAVVTFAFKSPSTAFQVSHGPLADVHAAWNMQCEACHRPNAGPSLDARAKWHDLTCQKCHAAPAHHASIPADDAVNTCSSCHHDHQGRTHSLVRLTDNHCVRCHANLASSAYITKVTNFADDHPPFRSLERRPSTMKFSHAQHMTAGMVLTEGAKGAWTLGKIPANDRERYRLAGQADTAAVQLDCTSCHSLDASSRSDGKYFAPIQFDQHCKACHATETGPTIRQSRDVVPSFAVPHGKQLEEMIKALVAEYSVKLQSEHKPLFYSSQPFDPKRKDDPAVKAFQDDVRQASESAKTFLSLACHKCHEMAGDVAKPSSIPMVWMTHAKFDHTAHRATDCKNCHPNTVAKFVGNDPNYERETVNILGVDSCRECHGPKRSFTSPKSGDRFEYGGVRHACTDCHRFHGGDQPLHGRGNPIRFPADRLTWQEFLKGKKNDETQRPQ